MSNDEYINNENNFERPWLNDPRRNVYSRPDLQSFKQALELTDSYYKVTRSITNFYDEKGRPDNKEEIQFLPLTIIPTGDYKVVRNAQGSWTAESYKISYVYPTYLRVEDIIEHPNYGRLRVLDVDDMREYGVMTATAVRINSIRPIMDSGEWK